MVAAPIPTSGDLRCLVRVERRHTGTPDHPYVDLSPHSDDTPFAGVANDDGYGNSEGEWETLIDNVPARLAPRRGGEQVIAARQTEVAPWDCWVRADPDTQGVTSGDRIVLIVGETGMPAAYAIRWVGNLDERGRFLVFQCETGRGSD